MKNDPFPEDIVHQVAEHIRQEGAWGGDWIPVSRSRPGSRDASPSDERARSVSGGLPRVQVPVRNLDAAGRGEARAALESVAAEIARCNLCGLHAGRTKTVPGDGHPAARLCFVGEGPGADEDRSGIPFVGRAGKLLTRMILAMGLERNEVFICNTVKCRPPGNRTPEPSEIRACLPYLERQIEILSPDVIVTLGRPAMQTLLETDAPMGRMRGRFSQYRSIPVMPTYHPAYLLRNPNAKGDTWKDLQEVHAFLERDPHETDVSPDEVTADSDPGTPEKDPAPEEGQGNLFG